MLPLISYHSIPGNGQKMLSHLSFPNNTGIIEREAGSFANFETAVNVEARRSFLLGKEYSRVVISMDSGVKMHR